MKCCEYTPRVGFRRTPYELLTIIIWVGGPYCKSDRDFFRLAFCSYDAVILKNDRKIIVRAFAKTSPGSTFTTLHLLRNLRMHQISDSVGPWQAGPE